MKWVVPPWQRTGIGRQCQLCRCQARGNGVDANAVRREGGGDVPSEGVQRGLSRGIIDCRWSRLRCRSDGRDVDNATVAPLHHRVFYLCDDPTPVFDAAENKS